MPVTQRKRESAGSQPPYTPLDGGGVPLPPLLGRAIVERSPVQRNAPPPSTSPVPDCQQG
jgi:hypothetical protein